MGKAADYIKRIEIMSLWNGRAHVTWSLKPEVNILSGVNGVGKSTILNRLVATLKSPMGGELNGNKVPGVKIEFSPKDATFVRFDVVRSFDRPLLHGDLIDKLVDGRVITELDFQLYQLQRRYLDYQVNIGNRMIEMLSSCDPETRERALKISSPKKRFQDAVDQLFSETGKSIDRKNNEIRFIQNDEYLVPYQLSSGEKQILVILLTVLIEDEQPYVLFMDEPEVSLHIEWQQRLIELIRMLNPNVQIILTTHSPAVIMDGWLDSVTEVSDITQ